MTDIPVDPRFRGPLTEDERVRHDIASPNSNVLSAREEHEIINKALIDGTFPDPARSGLFIERRVGEIFLERAQAHSTPETAVDEPTMFQPRYCDYDNVETGPLFHDEETAQRWIDANDLFRAGSMSYQTGTWEIDEIGSYPTGTTFVGQITVRGTVVYVEQADGTVERQRYLGLERADGRTWSSQASVEVVASNELDAPVISDQYTFGHDETHGNALPFVTRIFVASGGTDQEALLLLIEAEADLWLSKLNAPGAMAHFVKHGTFPNGSEVSSNV